MATTTIRWDYSGSTYTINYPDGLFQEVCKASKYFTDTDHRYDENILLIPANGSKLNYCRYEEKTHVIRRKYSRSGECTTTTDDYNTIVDPGPFEVWPNYSDIGRTYKDDLCKIMRPWMLYNGDMADVEEAWKHKTGKSETLFTYNISIEIYGTPNYFSSNAEFYYCWNRHLDEVATTVFDLQIYCASSYSSKKFVGGILVMDGDNVVDMGTTYIDPEQQLNGTYQYGANQLWFQRLDLNRFPAGGENAPSYGPFQQTSFRKTPMRSEECTVYDGFTFNWYPSIGEFLPPPKPYSLQGKRIRFIFDELVAISTGMCLYIEAFILQPGEKVEGDDKPPKPQIKRQIVRTNIDPENEPHPEIELTETGKKLIFPFPNYDEWRKEKAPTAPQFIFTTRKRVKDLYNNIRYSWTQGANLMFNNLFTYYPCDGQTLSGDSDSPQFLVSPSPGKEYGDVPLYPAGLNLYPVFHPTPCTYFKLHSTDNCDSMKLYGDDETNEFHKNIMSKLTDMYGENGFEYIDEKDWNYMTVDSKIEQIRKNTSPLKIIHIACPGTKIIDSDESGSLLSHTGLNDSKTNILTFDHIKALLKNAKPNEYYVIICTSGFGGGKFEDYIHNNVSNNDYSAVDISNELKNANCFILYSDNANSQAHLYSKIDKGFTRSVSHLLDFDNNEITYQQEVGEINWMVEYTRRLNQTELLNFMENTYQFMKNKLLLGQFDVNEQEGQKSYRQSWDATEERYDTATRNNTNLITCASRQKDGGIQMAREFPIVYCYLTMLKMPLCPRITLENPPVGRKEFVTDWGFLTWYARNFINTNIKMRDADGNIQIKKSIYPHLQVAAYPEQYRTILPPNWREDTELRQTFSQLVSFFYYMYLAQYNMCKNSQWVMRLNHVPLPCSFLLDDTPGVALCGKQEFRNSKLFTYPGYSDGSKGGISEEAIQSIIYKEEA